MALVGLDRIVLHTGMHPYFNQTWGYVALPFALVLALVGGRAAHARRPRPARAVPASWARSPTRWRCRIPLAFLLRLVAGPAARRRAAETIPPWWRLWQRIYRGWRSLLWIVPLALVAARPDLRRAREGDHRLTVVIDPDASLQAWGGDLSAWFPGQQFFG